MKRFWCPKCEKVRRTRKQVVRGGKTKTIEKRDKGPDGQLTFEIPIQECKRHA